MRVSSHLCRNLLHHPLCSNFKVKIKNLANEVKTNYLLYNGRMGECVNILIQMGKNAKENL